MDEVQVRSEETGIKVFETLEEAFQAFKKDPSIWKISFSFGEERVRLVNKGSKKTAIWVYEPIS